MNVLAESTKRLPFSIMVYNQSDSEMYSAHKGNYKRISVPSVVKPFLKEEKTHCSYFKRGSEMIVLYFIRFKLPDGKYTVVLQDGKQRLRLNSFISELFIHITNPYIADDSAVALAEKDGMISFLEMQLVELKEQAALREAEYLIAQEEVAELRLASASWEAERKSLIDNEEVKRLWVSAATEEVDKLREDANRLQFVLADLERQRVENQRLKEELAHLKANPLVAVSAEMATATVATQAAHTSTANAPSPVEQELRERLNAILLEKSMADEKLISKNDQIMSLTKEAERLAVEHSDMQLSLESAISERTVTTAELNVARQQLEIITIDKEQIAEKVALLEKNTEELRAALEENRHVAEEFEQVKLVLQEQQELNTKIDQQYKEVLANIEEHKSLIQDKELELSALSERMSGLNEALSERATQIEQISHELEEKEQAYEEQRVKVDTLTEEVEKSTVQVKELSKRSGELAGLNSILRKSRDKFSELVNGVAYPIFTVDENNIVVTSNKAFIKMCGKRSLVEVAGKSCFSMVGQAEACSWCAKDTVREQKNPVRVSVSTGQGSGVRHLDITFLPNLDPEGNVIEIAEMIDDNTENIELMSSVSKFKEKLRDFKRARIEDMNEVQELKRAYMNLSSAHDLLVGKNHKMLRVIERLATEDKARELLTTRTELLELRNKLLRATEMIKNYKYQLDEQTLRYGDLNRRTFLQMEKLFNLIKSKHNMRSDDSLAVLNFLTKEFEHVRRHFIETKKKQEAEDPKLTALKERVKSSEEKALRAKLSSKKPSTDDKENT
jgi:PAS domain-containing protein